MLEELMNKIAELTKEDPKTIIERCLKLGEEYGELSEAILSSNKVCGCAYKNKTNTDVLEEATDVIIMALSIICHSGMKDEFEIMLNKKLNKWETKTKAEKEK